MQKLSKTELQIVRTALFFTLNNYNTEKISVQKVKIKAPRAYSGTF
jgi:hypothetical protein